MLRTLRPLLALPALLLLLAGAPLHAQDDTPTERKLLLWRLTHGKTQTTSYLFGTIHVPDKRVLDLPKPVESAFKDAQAVYCELALEPSLQLAATKHMMLPAGKSLETILGKELYERAKGLLAKRGLPIAPFQRLRPWAFISQVQQLDYLEELQRGMLPLDAMLYNRAKKEGKTVGGLEKIEDQLGVFNSISQEGQVKMVASGLDGLEKAAADGTRATEPLLLAYLSGDIEAILTKSREDVKDDPEGQAFLKKLLDDRNVTMAQEIERLALAKADTAHFFAVGAAHYPGEGGILALLEARGFKVERVELSE